MTLEERMDKVEIWEVLLMSARNEISLKEAHNQICFLSGVSVSLLQKAYDLIPDGTSHEDLIEIKQALFSNKRQRFRLCAVP
jgi:hypothetical protein